MYGDNIFVDLEPDLISSAVSFMASDIPAITVTRMLRGESVTLKEKEFSAIENAHNAYWDMFYNDNKIFSSQLFQRVNNRLCYPSDLTWAGGMLSSMNVMFGKKNALGQNCPVLSQGDLDMLFSRNGYPQDLDDNTVYAQCIVNSIIRMPFDKHSTATVVLGISFLRFTQNYGFTKFTISDAERVVSFLQQGGDFYGAVNYIMSNCYVREM